MFYIDNLNIKSITEWQSNDEIKLLKTYNKAIAYRGTSYHRWYKGNWYAASPARCCHLLLLYPFIISHHADHEHQRRWSFMHHFSKFRSVTDTRNKNLVIHVQFSTWYHVGLWKSTGNLEPTRNLLKHQGWFFGWQHPANQPRANCKQNDTQLPSNTTIQ